MVPQFRLDSICVRWGSFVDPSLSPRPVCRSSSASIHWTRNKTRMAIWDSFPFLSRFSTIALTMHRLMSGDSGPSLTETTTLLTWSDCSNYCIWFIDVRPETKQRPAGDTNAKVALVSTNLVSWIVGTWSGDLEQDSVPFRGTWGVGVEMESRVGGWGGGFR